MHLVITNDYQITHANYKRQFLQQRFFLVKHAHGFYIQYSNGLVYLHLFLLSTAVQKTDYTLASSDNNISVVTRHKIL